MKAYLRSTEFVYMNFEHYSARRRYDWFLETRGNDFKPCPRPHIASWQLCSDMHMLCIITYLILLQSYTLLVPWR